MSHELRTPLNGIIGFSEILVDGISGPINEAQKAHLEDILSSAQHLLRLINNILDLTKVEAGKIELRHETFPLATVVAEVCSVIDPLVKKKNIALQTHLAPSLTHVTLDRTKLMQVLYNLLSNAIKFTDTDGRIDVRTSLYETDYFKLSVSDTGIGIKPENLPRLFKEFEQLDEGLARRYEGTGLGLALINKIVQAQGGTITVESESGKGSTFIVTLPHNLKSNL